MCVYLGFMYSHILHTTSFNECLSHTLNRLFRVSEPGLKVVQGSRDVTESEVHGTVFQQQFLLVCLVTSTWLLCLCWRKFGLALIGFSGSH